ncbi:MAG: hypothetical protein HDR80_05875 [Bacteroides sp.]|nr:hypothetical protein [Bacteroides sp.]
MKSHWSTYPVFCLLLGVLGSVFACKPSHRVTNTSEKEGGGAEDSTQFAASKGVSPTILDEESLIRDYASRKDVGGIFRVAPDKTLTYSDIWDMDERFRVLGREQYLWRIVNCECPDTVNVIIFHSWNPFPISPSGARLMIKNAYYDYELWECGYLYGESEPFINDSNKCGLSFSDIKPDEVTITFPPKDTDSIRGWKVTVDLIGPTAPYWTGPFLDDLYFVQPSLCEYDPVKISEYSRYGSK